MASSLLCGHCQGELPLRSPSFLADIDGRHYHSKCVGNVSANDPNGVYEVSKLTFEGPVTRGRRTTCGTCLRGFVTYWQGISCLEHNFNVCFDCMKQDANTQGCYTTLRKHRLQDHNPSQRVRWVCYSFQDCSQYPQIPEFSRPAYVPPPMPASAFLPFSTIASTPASKTVLVPAQVPHLSCTVMTSYKYEQLLDPQSYIRILTLKSGKFDDPLKGSLSMEQLAAKPAYEAISYVWGAPDTPHHIQLEQGSSSVSMAITENLNFALRRLRHNSEDRRLWTDAICINQEDDDEKSHQVREMTQIYCAAKTVLIYLGEQGDNTQQAFKLLDQIYNASKATAPEDTRSHMIWIRDHALPSAREPLAWEPLKAFFCRPWFTRKWTIQEAAVASKALLFCGDWTADWDLLEVVHHAIYKHGLAVLDHTTCKNQAMAKELQQGLTQLNSLVRVKNFWKRNGRYQLMDLVYQFQTARAKDPRDHLFALLGLAAEADDPDLRPEYKSNSMEKNAERYARRFLHLKGNLEVLYRAGLQGHDLKLPSWIPNWYGAHDTFAFEYAEGPWDPLRRPSFYNVAPGTNVQLIELTEPRVLGIRGVCIDSIRELANKYLQHQGHTQMTKDSILEQRRLHAEESDAIMSRISSYQTGEDPGEIHWRTLICNVAFDLTKAPAEYADSYQAWRRMNRVAGLRASVTDFTLQQRFREVIDGYNSDKIFGATEKGYVGMFPRTARAGDQVYVLFGGEFPFVLRKIKGQGYYQLVGQCYIHGIMEGQLDLKNYAAEEIYLAGTDE